MSLTKHLTLLTRKMILWNSMLAMAYFLLLIYRTFRRYKPGMKPIAFADFQRLDDILDGKA